ncbi:MAG TPA: hypothetical protein VF293_06225 [Candidatus Limnocylindrales bacterium]
MGTLERTETLTHRLGNDGRLTVKAVSGTLRARGIDGEDAHVTVVYRIRARDQASAERALDTGRVQIERGDRWLEIETPERRLSTGLAWLFSGARVNADISVEVPWGSTIRLETVSGGIEAVSLTGDQKYRTISGDVRLWSVGGPVDAGTVSGSFMLDKGLDVWLRASTVSGSLRARAERFRSMALSTTSGGMTVAGAFDPAGQHKAESIAGGLDLTPYSGVTVELKSVSGSIRADTQTRIEGGRGQSRAIFGDGLARLRLSSTSGSLRLTAPQRLDPVANSAPTGEGSFGPPPEAARSPSPATAASSEPTTTESWTAGSDADEAPVEPDEDQMEGDEDELAVLYALERGEIGVDEAADRLERPRS